METIRERFTMALIEFVIFTLIALIGMGESFLNAIIFGLVVVAVIELAHYVSSLFGM